MSKEGSSKVVSGDGDHHPPPLPQYGTFQGVAPHPHPPAMGFPQPVPPPGSTEGSLPAPYSAHGYQAVPGFPIAEGTPVRQRRLPCCGLGIGWFLFIIGFFLAGIPWYVAVFVLLCSRIDYREKPGYIACSVAAVIAIIVIIVEATKGAHDW